MAVLSREEAIDALKRLGELAVAKGEDVELLLFGGGVMVLDFQVRPSTRDLDVAVLSPRDVELVRGLARVVAAERGWPDDWLNDAAKGYLVRFSSEAVVFSSPGIVVRRPAIEQLLAMKLCAWRDDVDISDARHLLGGLPGIRDSVWQKVQPYLVPGDELKARYAFDDLWEELHGQS